MGSVPPSTKRRKARCGRGSIVPLLALSLLARPVLARSSGIAAVGCDTCHQGGPPPTVTLTSEPASPAVGQDITLTIRVAQANGSLAGFYLTTLNQAPGMFQAIESGTVATATDAMHITPRTATGGSTTFKVKWAASQATGVKFDVYAVAGNGDRSNRGDGAASSELELLIGCTGTTYYIDQDADGYGSSDPAYPPRKDCSVPAGFAELSGDCDDFRASVHPTAVEQCDLKDNDCDGNVDEDVVDQPYCQDQDGDGHGVTGGMTKVDCKPSAGFADCTGDCDDRDEGVHPGGVETCDGRDNDCDGKVDEGVRMVCGVGLCARYAANCTSACTPGTPFTESCNGFDDDCDGVVDNGDNALLCGSPDAPCVQGRCQGGNAGGVVNGAGGGAAASSNQGGAPGLAAPRAPAGCSLGRPQPPGGSATASAAVMAAALAFARRATRRSAKAH